MKADVRARLHRSRDLLLNAAGEDPHCRCGNQLRRARLRGALDTLAHAMAALAAALGDLADLNAPEPST